jgi:hypothetical protein
LEKKPAFVLIKPSFGAKLSGPSAGYLTDMGDNWTGKIWLWK